MSSNGWVWLYAALVGWKKQRSFARRVLRKLGKRDKNGFETSLPRKIPRIIWLYWDTGEASAPPVVAACIASWRERNPGWSVRVLDRDSLAELDMPMGPEDITVQAYSDLLRLRLLRREGGVWADATVMCLKPLDDWLAPLARHGFFAFIWDEADKWFILPNVHRVMTSWFLVSEAEGAIIAPWEARSFDYWKGRKSPHVYYWVHVIFEYLVARDRAFRAEWRKMPKLGAFGPHLVHDHVLKGHDPARIRAALESGAAPVQKLRWNWSEAELARAREVLDGLPPA